MSLTGKPEVSARRQVVGVCVHGLCVLLSRVLNVGGSAVLCFGRLVGGGACGIVCCVLACESVEWLVCRVLGACAAPRRRGVGPPFWSTWTF